MYGFELKQRYRAGQRDFTGVDLKNAYINWPWLIDVNLSGANLSGARLRRNRLINANLRGANLNNVALNVSFLIRADLSGTRLRGAGLGGADFTEANLTGADLTGADLGGAILAGANLTGANLTDINITERTIFCQTTMPDGRVKTDPSKVPSAAELLERYGAGERDFSGLVLYRVDLNGADLRNVKMQDTRFSYVSLRGANLENSRLGMAIGCDFRGANLEGADVSHAELIYCDFRGANLKGTYMSATDFTGSNLQGSQISLVGVEDPMFFCNTTWSDGEFIAGPIPADIHWSKPTVYDDF